MGTTKTALQGDQGVRVGFVLVIEGYDLLLTDAETPSDIFQTGKGWNGLGWNSALGGLEISGVWEQDIDPWKAKFNVRQMTFTSPHDRLGRDVHKRGAGDETKLRTALDPGDTDVDVVEHANLSSPVFIGPMRIDFTGTSGTSAAGTAKLTGATIGKHAPFSKLDDGSHVFGRHVSLPSATFGVRINPRVVDTSREWVGKTVGLWCHRVNGGDWDTKAEAELVWAGVIAEPFDTEDGKTALVCDSIESVLRNTTLLHDQFEARVADGFFLASAGTTPVIEYSFSAVVRLTTGSGTTVEDADHLTPVVGASVANEVEAGNISYDELVDGINEWLADEKNVDANITPRISFKKVSTADGFRTLITATLSDGVNYSGVNVTLYIPVAAAEFMGFDVDAMTRDSLGRVSLTIGGGGIDQRFAFMTSLEPYRLLAAPAGLAAQGLEGIRVYVDSTRGEWFDNSDWIPEPWRSQVVTSGQEWGLYLVGKSVLIGYPDSASSPTYLVGGGSADVTKMFGTPALEPLGLRASEAGGMVIKQIAVIDGALKDVIARLFASTGDAGYNHATYDAFPSQLGAGIPWELLGSAFEDTLDQVEQTAQQFGTPRFVIEKPTSLEKVISPDLLLRGATLIWKDGGLRFSQPQSPIASIAVHNFTEAGKASLEPGDAQRAMSRRTDKWLRNVVKIEFNREALIGGKYTSSITIRHAESIAAHGERPVTIKARNTYGEQAGGAIVEALADYIASYLLPLYARPFHQLRRTISFQQYLGIAPGDLGTINDDYARDPITGERGVSGRPVLIMAHRFAFGISSEQDGFGEVWLAMPDMENFAIYSPTLQIDEGATNAGYSANNPSAGKSLVRVYPHDFSEASEDPDEDNFAVNDVVDVIEIDSGGAPQRWTGAIVEAIDNVNHDVQLNSLLGGFDTSGLTKYRITATGYTNAAATQKSKAFMADDADHRIADLREPYEYGSSLSSVMYTGSPSTELPEEVASEEYGDGRALTTAVARAQARLVNNLIDYRTAPQMPIVPHGAAWRSQLATGWEMVAIIPWFVGPGQVHPSARRDLSIRPSLATTDAAETASMRVTMAMAPPGGDDLADLVIADPKQSVTFTRTGSTAYSILTAQDLPAVFNERTGVGYILVEMKISAGHAFADSWGLVECRLKERG